MKDLKKIQEFFSKPLEEAELKLGVKYGLPNGDTGYIMTQSSDDPKDWIFSDGFKKVPYLSVKKELKPLATQPGKYDGAFDLGLGKGHHIDERMDDVDNFAGSDPKAGSMIQGRGFDWDKNTVRSTFLKKERAQLMRDREQEAEHHIDERMDDEDFDSLEDAIANREFGMDYNQLGPNEKEWVRDEMSMNERIDFDEALNLRAIKVEIEDEIIQLRREMEDEGDESKANYYGGKLNKLEDKLAKVKKQLDDYDMNESVSKSKMPTQSQVDRFFTLTQNETHYLNSKPVQGQKKTPSNMEVEPWDEYDLSNWNALVRKAKAKGKSLDEATGSKVEVVLSNQILDFLQQRNLITGVNAQKVHKDLTAFIKNKKINTNANLNENNSYARVSMPSYVKDKKFPNFLYVNIEYDLGPGGSSIALGKETMSGQIRRESAAEAMRLAGDVARDLKAEYDLEDIDIVDKENGVVQVFAVSDDFINMDPNMLGESLNENDEEEEVDYSNISSLEDELRRLRRWSSQYGSKGADSKIEYLEQRIEYLKSNPLNEDESDVYRWVNNLKYWYDKSLNAPDVRNTPGGQELFKSEVKKWVSTLNEAKEEDKIDIITMDVPLFIRALEYAKEDAQEDMDLHDFAERAIAATKEQGILQMDDYDMLVGGKEPMGESNITEASVPSNIKSFAKRKGVTALVNKVAGWAEKVGARISGGTAIGYNYSTLVLDMKHQAGEIRINTDNDTIKLYNTPVNSFPEFKKIYDEKNPKQDLEEGMGGQLDEKYFIEVSVRDARKALSIFDDQFRSADIKMYGSNVYASNDFGDMYDLYNSLIAQDIEISDLTDFDQDPDNDNLYENVAQKVIDKIKEAKPGLWANINAKQKRGEKPSHGNSDAFKSAVKAGKEINKLKEEEGVPHYTKDGKLYDGPTHKDASGKLMTGDTHTSESEYLYHKEDLNEFEDGGTEEKAFDSDLMVAANGIASTLGKELKAKQGEEKQLDEAIVTSAIAAVLTGNALIGFISKMTAKLMKKLNYKKGEDIAEKIHHWAHDNETAFQTPIKRVLAFFIKDKQKLDITTKAIYAIIIAGMAAGYGADAVSSLGKADWFKSALASLKTLAKSDEAIVNAYPAIKSLMV
jgi:hypothetical protein